MLCTSTKAEDSLFSAVKFGGELSWSPVVNAVCPISPTSINCCPGPTPPFSNITSGEPIHLGLYVF